MHAGRFRLTYACLRNATARVGEIARQPPSATSRRRRRRSQSHTVLELLLQTKHSSVYVVTVTKSANS
jgi:hypothetical protein